MICYQCFHLVADAKSVICTCLRWPGSLQRHPGDTGCEHFLSIEEGKRLFAPPLVQSAGVRRYNGIAEEKENVAAGE